LSFTNSHSLQAQDSEPLTDRVFYTVFEDYVYYLNSINLEGTDQQFLAQSNSGWFRVSPSGEQLVLLQHRSGSLMEGEYDIYLMNLDSSESLQLTSTRHNAQPTWSPNGDVIAYLSGQSDNFDIYLLSTESLDIDSEVPVSLRLTDIGSPISNLEWSPTGDRLAFIVCEDDNACDVYIVAIDGTGLENISDDFDESISSISWSPDGSQLAFLAYPSGEYQNADIYLFDLQLGTVTKLTSTTADYMFLEWSPDGSSLAYASDQNETWDIYLLNFPNLEAMNLTDDSDLQDGVYGLSWSPDGRQMVFSTGPIEGDFEIFVMNSDGTDRYQLTDNEAHDTNPMWVIKAPN
jgi:TolB protein